MDVSWNPPSKRKHHGVITNYVIKYQKDGHSENDLIDVLGTEHMVTINNLDKGKVYTVEVAAKTSGGLGPFSQKISGTVLSIPTKGKLTSNMSSLTHHTRIFRATWIKLVQVPRKHLVNFAL